MASKTFPSIFKKAGQVFITCETSKVRGKPVTTCKVHNPHGQLIGGVQVKGFRNLESNLAIAAAEACKDETIGQKAPATARPATAAAHTKTPRKPRRQKAAAPPPPPPGWSGTFIAEMLTSYADTCGQLVDGMPSGLSRESQLSLRRLGGVVATLLTDMADVVRLATQPAA